MKIGKGATERLGARRSSLGGNGDEQEAREREGAGAAHKAAVEESFHKLLSLTSSAAETSRKSSKKTRNANHHSKNARGLESKLACKQPSVDSGATAIGSTARAPDGKSRQKVTEITEGRTKHWRRLHKLESTTKSSSAGSKDMKYIFEPMLACKQPNIGSGATAIGSAARAPDEDSRRRIDMQGAKHRVLTHKSSGANP
ncbi:Hypothetical predicted protein [Olea europaea subsp. europaea]|uniref:Uncharacterized protein n=1 Tax=Olea europaea subsp. europaea TaxID=158383 RepID=A0A8S0VPJ5_OLEEU|nr:Hypothetical predicted protein [Olea europaea subsp. europaea]